MYVHIVLLYIENYFQRFVVINLDVQSKAGFMMKTSIYLLIHVNVQDK